MILSCRVYTLTSSLTFHHTRIYRIKCITQIYNASFYSQVSSIHTTGVHVYREQTAHSKGVTVPPIAISWS